MSYEIHVDFEHPANAGVLQYLAELHRDSNPLNLPPSISPDDVDNPYMRLGTHPDIVRRLWDESTTALPERCAWVIYGKPVLVQAATGILFGMAAGTTYMIRLPEPEYSEAIHSGVRTKWIYNDAWLKKLGPEHNTVLDLEAWGIGWVFGDWQRDWTSWCLIAYQNPAWDSKSNAE